MEARQGQNPECPGLGLRQPSPEGGQAQTTAMEWLLEAARRWEIPVARYMYELTQASSSYITSERRNDVLGVDRADHPEPTFLPDRLNVRCPDQATIRVP